VVIQHCYLTYPDAVRLSSGWSEPWQWLRHAPLDLLVSGRAAVIVFFVLSGFVLTLQLTGPSRPSYSQYLIRRFFRLYVPFAVVVLLSYALHFAVAPATNGELSEFYNLIWRPSVTPRELSGHLLMTGLRLDMWLDVVMWTLVHEVRISIILPLLLLCVRTNVLLTLLTGLALFVATDRLLTGVRWDSSLSASLLATLHYVLFFLIGTATAVYRGPIKALIASTGAAGKLTALLASIAMLMCTSDSLVISESVFGIGAALLISVCFSALSGRSATPAPLSWLGRISYSLYLTHILVLVITVDLLFGKMPLLAILMFVFLLSLGFAHLVYCYVELPSIQLGRILIQQMRVTSARSVPQAIK